MDEWFARYESLRVQCKGRGLEIAKLQRRIAGQRRHIRQLKGQLESLDKSENEMHHKLLVAERQLAQSDRQNSALIVERERLVKENADLKSRNVELEVFHQLQVEPKIGPDI